MGRSDIQLPSVGGGEFNPSGQASLRLPQDSVQSPRGLAIPDHPTLRAVGCALLCAGPAAAAAGWRPGEGDAQIVQRVGLVEPVRVHLNARDAVAAWRAVCAVSPLTLDAFTVLLDRFRAAGAEVLLVRSAEILDAKGSHRWGQERHVLEQQIGRELMRLGRMSLAAADQPLFTVTPVDGGGTRFVVALDPAVKALWDAAPVLQLNRRLLQFDHRLNRGADVLAKKMGLYFSLTGAGSGPMVRTVRSVLKGVGGLEELSHGRGGRVADRFEEALLRLHEHSLFTVTYRCARTRSLLDMRVKGWVKRWADAELVVMRCG